VGSLEITKINVSKCSGLQFLDLSTNLLTELDISNNKVLSILEVGNNNLTGITLNTTSLTSLRVSYNDLPYIVTTGNTNLGALFASHNPATFVDIGTNVNLGIGEFIGMTNLTGLTITGQTTMTDFFSYDCPELTYLNLEDSFRDTTFTGTTFFGYNCPKLTNINLKNSTGLREALIGDCNIQTYDFTNCSTLNHLVMSNSVNLKNLNTTPLTSLNILTVENCGLTGLTMSSVVRLEAKKNNFVTLDLTPYTSLTYIDVTQNNLMRNIDVSGLSNLVTFFPANSAILSGVTLSNNTSLYDFDAESCNITYIDLSYAVSL
jgi:hypothetical protein